MLEVVKTVYRNGVFIPKTPVDLPEDTEIEIVVEKKGASVSTDESNLSTEERSRLLKQLVERMQKNPVPLNAPRFNREELYDRR